ncbi:PREDICTED: zinc finger BED domain-containing protein DAYSLEEPER-like [Tarenaya hassleriana]|uniref:zinc finger BED domain-containing protein DAYSLEEPER-like n=1 Tax=Tarenaya hassleriana TaxID=28532 RepID=UPI00053C6287|nr:PREDICTED: zinc finger BED domain-containing protein DAYSLEEPER-like [Tarenaya hassleriana]
MDNNSLMLIDNDGSFEMDDHAHMDVEATENNAMTVFNPTTPVADADDSALLEPDTQPSKRRRKKSMVWEHFTIETVSPGSTKASCKHCKKSFAYITGSKLAGTSHLKRHIALGICPMSRQNNQLTLTPETKDRSTTGPPKKRQRSSAGYTNIPLDQDRCYHEMAKMIIMHEYPLHMVEHPGFAGFVQTLQPQFNMASFNTIHGDCVSMYLSQKQKLTDLIGEIPGRVNLTIDLWTSNQSVGYAFLTGHFIDRDWNLTSHLLNVLVVPSPDSDFALNQPVAACLSDWNLERKLSSLTVDQSAVNKTAIENLRGFLSVRNPHVLNGQLLMGRCYARLISSMAQDALGAEEIEKTIKKIRDSVKYVKTSDSCEERFYEVKRQLQTPCTKDLLIDDQTKWNTTYNMLLSAWEHKEVFSCLETYDPDYKITISSEEWRKVEIICSCLKVLFDAASVLTGPTHLTANDMYHEMTKLQLALSNTAISEDPDVRNLATPMREKFDEYWSQCFLVLAVAVVMDPRFKMKLIEFSFSKMYGEDAGKWIKTVDDAVHDLYHDYAAQNFPLLDAYVGHGNHDVPGSEMSQEVHFHQELAHEHHHGNGISHDHAHEVNLYGQAQNGHLQNEQSKQDHVLEIHEPQEPHQSYAQLEGHELAVESLPQEGQIVEEHSQEDQQTDKRPQGEQATESVSREDQSIEVLPKESQSLEVQSGEGQLCETVSTEVQSVEVGKEDFVVEAVPQENQCEERLSSQENSQLEGATQERQSTQEDQQANGQLTLTQESQQTDEPSQGSQPMEDIPDKTQPQEEMPQESQPAEDISHVGHPVEEMVQENLSGEDMAQNTQPVEDISQVDQPVEEVGQENLSGEDMTQGTEPQGDEPVEDVVQDNLSGEDMTRDTQPMEDIPQDLQPVEEMGRENQSVVDDMAEDTQPIDDIPSDTQLVEETEQETQPMEETVQETQPVEEIHEEPQPPKSEEAETEEPQPMEDLPELPQPGASQPAEVQSQSPENDDDDDDDDNGLPQEPEHTESLPEELQGLASEEMQARPEQSHHHHHEDHSFTISQEDSHQVDVLLQEGHHLEASSHDFPLITIGDGFSDFELYISDISSHQQMKSELDQYLEESLMPRSQDFDVLGWWKLNRTKYPTLSKMAADVLSVPFCTVAPDSVFDTKMKKMDCYRSSLRSVTLEALICAKDWFKHGSSPSNDSSVKRE